MDILPGRALTILVAAMLAASLGDAAAQNAVPSASGIWRSNDPSHRLSGRAQQRLLRSLRRITGVDDIDFDAAGRMTMGEGGAATGSTIAKWILQRTLMSPDIFVIEEHSGSPNVDFGQIEGMDYFDDARGERHRVWWIRLDLEDFVAMTAPPRVRASFDEGVTFLHELLHALGCHDPTADGELGTCETIINQVRSEIGLPLRVEYFGTLIHLAPDRVITRLRFRDEASGPSGQRTEHLFSALSTIAPAGPAVVRRRAR